MFAEQQALIRQLELLQRIASFASQVSVRELGQLQSSAVVYRLFDASSNRRVDDCKVFSDRVSELDSLFEAYFEEDPESGNDFEVFCETLSEASLSDADSESDSDAHFDLPFDLLFV